MPQKLTEKKVAALSFNGKNEKVRDEQVTGLFVDIHKCSKSYKCQADLWVGERGKRTYVRTVRINLGRTGELPLDVARARAAELVARIKSGVDPRAPKPKEDAPALTVGAAFRSYADRCLSLERSDRTVEDLERFLGYLDLWRDISLTSITKAMARERHAALARDVGPVAANKAMRALRAVWNHINKTRDEDIGVNPVLGVTFKKERSKNRSLAVDDLEAWYAALGKAQNPMRRLMHELGLFTGLRPGNLVSLERSWVQKDRRAIVIPAERMKARREFALPLSEHLLGLVDQILALSNMVESGSLWMFPTRDFKGQVTHTQVWKERVLPSETGHILRHTFSNVCALVGVDGDTRQMLLGQSVAGVRGVYLHSPAIWTRLLSEQERVSAYLLSKIGVSK